MLQSCQLARDVERLMMVVMYVFNYSDDTDNPDIVRTPPRHGTIDLP